ncbi:hypothetical protein Tsubulata_042517 [Turnera subulata]|uniref:DC1 domain-containing protein n=1 Tax=Turnera subulata TaxID=218843 RepID=A0A9Q0JFV7_9ROSI|nr:hypothetical protein Tsubulata_042517 [Turnera subulata]
MGSMFESPYVCKACQLIVHRDCLELPPTINILQHPHPISHTYNFPRNHQGELDRSCNICREDLKEYIGGYRCPEGSCDFDAHIHCAMQYTTQIHPGKPDEEEGKPEDQEKAKIKHFSHDHDLVLVSKVSIEVEDHGRNCELCNLPLLSLPFYSCTECDFLLDQACAQLKRRIKYREHEHPFTLQVPTVDQDEVFYCLSCRHYYHGFFYRCEECDITVDAGCIKILMDGYIKHQSHDHLLFVAKYNSQVRGVVGLFAGCKACGVRSNKNVMGEYLRCGTCHFNLDFTCARRPGKIINDRYDQHPFFLRYHPLDDGCEEYYCRICEETRNNDLWFYYCEKCDTEVHPGCLGGDCPNLKLGGTYTLPDVHPHSLTLQESSLDFPAPPCHECKQPCDGAVYECTDPECLFACGVGLWLLGVGFVSIVVVHGKVKTAEDDGGDDGEDAGSLAEEGGDFLGLRFEFAALFFLVRCTVFLSICLE